MDDILQLGSDQSASLILHRFWAADTPAKPGDIAADAVLSLLASKQSTPSIFMTPQGHVIPNKTPDPIELGNGVSAQVTSVTFNGQNVQSATIMVTSKNLSASQLVTWLKDQVNKYSDHQLNQFSDKLFYFENRPPKVNGDPRGFPGEDPIERKRMTLLTAPKQLTFAQYNFVSNKTFSNIYGEQAHIIERRIKFFLENKQWYDSKGIPYQIGIMLTGIPGSGKTSIIRAIANRSKRHIISVNCANIQTATQFKNLFLNEELHIQKDEHTVETIRIPLNQRIYVLDEIDAMGHVVRSRGQSPHHHATVPDELTLADILTTFDGTMEVSGRILLVTTNHPDILDDALMRPGRIDYCATFGYADRGLIKEMYEAFFESEFPEALIDKIPENVLSPAEVSECFFKMFTSQGGFGVDPEMVVNKLVKLPFN